MNIQFVRAENNIFKVSRHEAIMAISSHDFLVDH